MGRVLPLVAAIGLLASGCAAADAGADDGRLRIATTVSPITNIVATIAGERAEVTGIVPEGTNSHTFEPPPSTAELLATADLVVINGLQLEEPTRELAEANAREDATILSVGDAVLSPDEYVFDDAFPEAEGKPNPHLWTDPGRTVEYAEAIADTLTSIDPDGADTYERNLTAFTDAVDDLDAAMRTAFATIPEAQRKLLTYHDSFAYMAPEYGLEVIGAIQVSDFEDPTPRELARLIDQVRTTGVPAIFGSEVFPSPVLEQIGRETGVRYVDTLRDDDLPGAPGDPDHSWLGLLRFDYVTITTALGGDATALEDLELPDLADDAEYPQ